MCPSYCRSVQGGGPKVVMKLDMEGMEFVTLPDLMMSGILCKTVDDVFGEFHYEPFFFPMRRPKQGILIKHGKEARDVAKVIRKQFSKSLHCKTTLCIGDDETYLHDPRPLPKPETG